MKDGEHMRHVAARVLWMGLAATSLAAVSLVVAGCGQTSPAIPPITTTGAKAVNLNILAATSLTPALKEINGLYVRWNPNVTITPNFASSGTLQTQIENGAPADVFIAAAATQMDKLQLKDRLVVDTRRDLLNNRLVLIIPGDSTLDLTSFNDVALDKVQRLAIGDPKSVPAGTYAQQAFDLLGIAAQVQSKVVLGADARQVLTYVESGNVEAGIVYATDAMTSNKVKVVASAPAGINANVVYPAAVIKGSRNQEAAGDYLNFLFGSQARTVFERYGFTLVSR
jgi:molybdate transport system substrate-binding protein